MLWGDYVAGQPGRAIMSDRHHSYTVVLEHVLKDEDSDEVIQAIKMVKGVADVVPHVADGGFYIAREQAKSDLRRKMWKVIQGENHG